MSTGRAGWVLVRKAAGSTFWNTVGRWWCNHGSDKGSLDTVSETECSSPLRRLRNGTRGEKKFDYLGLKKTRISLLASVFCVH